MKTDYNFVKQNWNRLEVVQQSGKRFMFKDVFTKLSQIVESDGKALDKIFTLETSSNDKDWSFFVAKIEQGILLKSKHGDLNLHPVGRIRLLV